MRLWTLHSRQLATHGLAHLRLPACALAVLLALLGLSCGRKVEARVRDGYVIPGSQSAERPGEAVDPLEGIDTEYQKPARLTIYFPWLDRWPTPDIDMYPIVTRHDSGTKQLLVRVALRDVPDWKGGALEMAIDSSPVVLDLNEAGKPKFDLGGCHSTLEVDLPAHEEVLRRIAVASEVEVRYGEGRRRKVYRFLPEDFDRYRRMLDLHSRDPLPPARPDFIGAPWAPVPGAPAQDVISPPEIIPGSRNAFDIPIKALRKKPKGALIIRARVFRDGSVGKVRVWRPAGGSCGFEEAALAAIRQWRYSPAKVRGQPIDVDLTMPIDLSAVSWQSEDNFMRMDRDRPRKPPRP